jgi:glyoxylase-like metal-dependent hydrolase (beta-lactamase superfamily II)
MIGRHRTQEAAMVRRMTAGVLVAVAAASLSAQRFPPGFVDPEPVLKAAAAAIGADQVSCITMTGSGYAGIVGQQRLAEKNVDWPRGEPLANYTRTMNWAARTMVESFDRKPGLNPASWKWGLGWIGGTPVQQQSRQTFAVNDKHAWSIDGTNPPVAASALDAERAQLELWLNPHGFLKAARMPGANPVAVWRWELGEMGRDGPTTIPERVTVVSIQMLGKYRVDATINKENMLQRIHTWVPDPVLGDMNYEHEFTNASYVDAGRGIRFPTSWHHHAGWDDNYNTQTVTAGHNGFGGNFKQVTAAGCDTPVPVPDPVRGGPPAERVATQKLAEGVYLLGGASHNSVAVEFQDYVAVVEAPLSEERSLAVIEEIVRLVPAKPIRFLVNTHQHFDHIGGMRTYLHIGATVITHIKNYDFYNRDVLNYTPRTVMPDMVSRWPPTELTEGYNLETIRENYALTDAGRTMKVFYVQPLQHVEGMLMAYLPNEKLLIEADLFDTHAGRPGGISAATRSLVNQVRALGLEVDRVVPIHGAPAPWSDVLAAVAKK